MINKKLFLIILSLSTIILLIAFINKSIQLRYMQNNIDDLFEFNIFQTLNGFSNKFNEMELQDVDSIYSEAKTGIESASQLINLTSYKKNEELQETILVLRNYINKNTPIKIKVDYNINSKIYDLINEMYYDLDNKEKCIELKNYIL